MPVRETDSDSPAANRVTVETSQEFQRRLREGGVNAHLRSSRGKDVDAACGQLRRCTRDL
ncbi:MAG: hypothetical protein ACE5I3_12800 [Phycisphaerae bacterium]